MPPARIRTIKPELLRHEVLYELERKTRLPLRIAWAGLFCVADREGRFEWKPKVLKLDVLPHDRVDFEKVLQAFAAAGFIIQYVRADDEERRLYGWIPTFWKHQVINHREGPSKLPDPTIGCKGVGASEKRFERAIKEETDRRRIPVIPEAEDDVEGAQLKLEKARAKAAIRDSLGRANGRA